MHGCENVTHKGEFELHLFSARKNNNYEYESILTDCEPREQNEKTHRATLFTTEAISIVYISLPRYSSTKRFTFGMISKLQRNDTG